MTSQRWNFWSKPTTTTYVSVPSSEDGEKDTRVQKRTTSSISDFFAPGILIPILVCILCTSINLYVFNNRPPRSINDITRDDIPNLRRPSQFIGLDKVKRPFPPIPRTLLNYPMLLAQIDKANPSFVYPDDPKAHMTYQGTISPEDRNFLITDTVSTIAQFRVLDWGMESCELTIQFPPMADIHPSEDTVVNLGPDANVVDLYFVSSPKPINAKKLNYRSRPARTSKVASINVHPNTTWTHKFDCEMDSLQTFEFASGSKGTVVDWWQDKEGSMPALFMNQYATK